MSAAEYHDKPSPHLVLSDIVWERWKRQFSNNSPDALAAREGSTISGQRGIFDGTPVYIDRCPWDCSGESGVTPT